MNNLSLSTQVDSIPFTLSKNKIEHLRAEVIFGRASRDCAGHGICRVEVLTKQSVINTSVCSNSIAFIQQGYDKRIHFYFLNSSLCIKAQKKYFRKDTFQVQEPFMLPYGISQSFEMEQNFIIKNGLYPIVKTDKYSIVIF